MPAIFVTVRDIPLGELARFPGNARRGDVGAIRASLRRHGQYRSLVVRDTGSALVVLAGNHTRDALDAEGLASARCEVITCTDDEARRINLADNRLAELGGYDDADLAALLEGLDGDFDGTGWAQEDLDALLAEEPESRTDPDDVPEPPAEPVTKPGDLWQLGPHRLLCGDALHDMDRLLDGAKPDTVITDPPYGIDANQMTLGSGKKEFRRGEAWDAEAPPVRWLLDAAERVVIWGGNYFADELPVTNDWLCWHKKNDGLSFSEFELAWTNLGKNCRHLSHHWSGEEKKHPTQKPVAVIEWCLGLALGDVLDPYAGSGTTLLAAHRFRRRSWSMELDPAYCDVIVQRYRDHTGIEPELLEA